MDVKEKSTGSKKRWKLLIVILIIAVIMVPIGFLLWAEICSGNNELPPSPDEFGNAKWASESSDVWFEVNGEDDQVWEGELTVEGKTYSCKVGVAYYNIYFWQGEANSFWECKKKDILLYGHYYYKPKPGKPIKDAPKKLVIDVSPASHFFSDKRLELIRCP